MQSSLDSGLYNLSAIERDGTMPEKDYNKSMRSLVRSLKDFRVSSIRCNLLWEPETFEKYEQEAIENYDRKCRPVQDPDLAFDFECLPLSLRAKFDVAYWPDFYREYESPSILDKLIHQEDAGEGFIKIPSGEFRSVVLSGYQIEQELRQRYRKTSLYDDISSACEIEVEFLCPAKFMVNFGDLVTVRATYFILPE